jgi:hypothetical protein
MARSLFAVTGFLVAATGLLVGQITVKDLLPAAPLAPIALGLAWAVAIFRARLGDYVLHLAALEQSINAVAGTDVLTWETRWARRSAQGPRFVRYILIPAPYVFSLVLGCLLLPIGAYSLSASPSFKLYPADMQTAIWWTYLAFNLALAVASFLFWFAHDRRLRAWGGLGQPSGTQGQAPAPESVESSAAN